MILSRLARIYGHSEADFAHHRPPSAPPVDPQRATAALLDYYQSPGYNFSLRHHAVRTAAVTPPACRNLRIPLLTAPGFTPLAATASPTPIPAIDPHHLARCAAPLTTAGTRLWDGRIWRLAALSSAAPLVTLSEDSYLHCRLTSGLMREEWQLVLAEAAPPLLRDHFAPNLQHLLDGAHRPIPGGVHTLCAFARGAPHHDYVIPLQQRSTLVSEGAGRIGVVPMGLHHPSSQPGLPATAPAATALREIFEELFNGPESELPHFLDHPAIAWILAHSTHVTFELNALFFSLASGNYDFALVLAVHHPHFWQQFAPLVQTGWESAAHMLVSTRDDAAWERLLLAPNWEPQALGCCVEGLMRLAALDPDRCPLPTLTAS